MPALSRSMSYHYFENYITKLVKMTKKHQMYLQSPEVPEWSTKYQTEDWHKAEDIFLINDKQINDCFIAITAKQNKNQDLDQCNSEIQVIHELGPFFSQAIL